MVAKDSDGNVLQVGDRVVALIQVPAGVVEIVEIKPILQQGPRQGGLHVAANLRIEWDLPPGHQQVPVFLIFKGRKEDATPPSVLAN